MVEGFSVEFDLVTGANENHVLGGVIGRDLVAGQKTELLGGSVGGNARFSSLDSFESQVGA